MANSDVKTEHRIHPRWAVVVATLVVQVAFGLIYAWATASV